MKTVRPRGRVNNHEFDLMDWEPSDREVDYTTTNSICWMAQAQGVGLG
ncbi:MAG: hypothetical protein MK198_15315 [Gracilimonas sp.]|nr:hypothetical protein [Gracilimonas sp.]